MRPLFLEERHFIYPSYFMIMLPYFSPINHKKNATWALRILQRIDQQESKKWNNFFFNEREIKGEKK